MRKLEQTILKDLLEQLFVISISNELDKVDAYPIGKLSSAGHQYFNEFFNLDSEEEVLFVVTPLVLEQIYLKHFGAKETREAIRGLKISDIHSIIDILHHPDVIAYHDNEKTFEFLLEIENGYNIVLKLYSPFPRVMTIMDLYLTKDELLEPNLIEKDIPVLLDFDIDIMGSAFKAVSMITNDEDRPLPSSDSLASMQPDARAGTA